MKILILTTFLFFLCAEGIYCETPSESYSTVNIAPLMYAKKSFDEWNDEANKIDTTTLSFQDLALFALTKTIVEVFDGYIYDITENAEGYVRATKQGLSSSCQKRMYEMYGPLLPFVKGIGEQSKEKTLLLRDEAKEQGLRVLLNNAAKVLMQLNAALASMIKEAEAITSAATASGDGG